MGLLVAVKDRLNGLKNPYAHLRLKDINRDMVESSPMLWDPIRYLESCPSSALDGKLPINPSGGVLCSNPIGASGMLRFAEAALQVRAHAGEHQVDGARRAMGHAYGGGSQFFAMWIVGSEEP